MDALETEVEYSHSSLNYVLLQAMEVSDEDSQFASSHMGVCGGIITLLRAIPHHSANVIHSYLDRSKLIFKYIYIYTYSTNATNIYFGIGLSLFDRLCMYVLKVLL